MVNFLGVLSAGVNSADVMVGFGMSVGLGITVWIVSHVIGVMRRLFDNE